jgi:HPt (histidine-containing phosphotransfer) domain-containing protein
MGATAMSQHEIFDKASLLERLDDDEALCREISNTFLQDLTAQLVELKHLLYEYDLPLVKRQAHTIKGASANMGAEALSCAAYELETVGSEADPSLVWSLLGKLEDEYKRFRAVLSDQI